MNIPHSVFLVAAFHLPPLFVMCTHTHYPHTHMHTHTLVLSRSLNLLCRNWRKVSTQMWSEEAFKPIYGRRKQASNLAVRLHLLSDLSQLQLQLIKYLDGPHLCCQKRSHFLQNEHFECLNGKMKPFLANPGAVSPSPAAPATHWGVAPARQLFSCVR